LKALDKAVELMAKEREGHMYVIHVVEIVQPFALDLFHDMVEHLNNVENREKGRQVKAMYEKLCMNHAEIKSSYISVEHPRTKEAICEKAKELGVDIVIVGNRGLSTVQRLLLGSVSEHVVRNAPCSVLVVR